jgi:hypothetical protein
MCLSHQSTQTINHPLPTHAVAVLWGSCSSHSPSQGSGGSCWDPPGLPRFSREVADYSDNRWASQISRPCSQPFSSHLVQGWGKAAHPGTCPLSPGGDGAGLLEFPLDAGEIGPLVICRTSGLCPRGFRCVMKKVPRGVFPSS